MVHSSSLEAINEILSNDASKKVLIEETKNADNLTETEKEFVMNLIQSNGDIKEITTAVQSSVERSAQDEQKECASKPPDDSASGPNSNNNNGAMKPVDFFKYIVTTVEDADWNDFEFQFQFQEKKSYIEFSGNTETKDDMLVRVEGELDVFNGCDKVSATCGSKSFNFRSSNLTKDLANQNGFVSYSRRDKLTEYLGRSRNTIMKGMGTNGVLAGDLNFVETNTPDFLEFFKPSRRQQDKEYAIVVAGESGAGKTCLAYLAAEKAEYTILYKSLSEKKKTISSEPGGSRKRKRAEMVEQNSEKKLEEVLGERASDECTNLNQFLRHVVCLVEANVKGENLSEYLQLLYNIKTKINFQRDAWAKKVLELCIKEALSDYHSESEFKMWFGGQFNGNERPKNLAIIIDEVVDTDLAEGLVSTVRETTALYSTLAENHVRLVIVGTGLDQIRYGDRVGTNPALSRLIIVKKPDVTKIGDKLSEIECRAIIQGRFSKFLCSNSRMLFRSLIPIMKLPFHTEDSHGLDHTVRSLRLEERLKDVGSTRCLMDHAPRFYVNQNSVGNLESGSRDNLLAHAFFVHQKNQMDKIASFESESIQKIVRDFKDQLTKNVIEAEELLHNGKDTIYNRGLVSLSGTSSALKFLACFGLTCEVRPGFGDEFEELTALHVLRTYQAKGYKTKRIRLKYAYPAATERGENEKEEFLLEKHGERICYVFDQGTPSAEGPDVLVLVSHHTSDHELLIIQCKHYQQSPGPKTVRKWWNSLGVYFRENSETSDWEPKQNQGNDDPPDFLSAARSFAGIEEFCELMQKKLQNANGDDHVTVRVGDRILACSFETPRGKVTFPMPKSTSSPRNNPKVSRVWFREMLEPTISVFDLKPAEVPLSE